jgi:tagatose-1,6-bisphosphate aldolase
MDTTIFQEKQAFPLLALDHRTSLKETLYPDNPDQASVSELQQVKSDILHALAGTYNGILLDSEYGLPVYDTDIAPYLLRIGTTEYSTTEEGEEQRTTVQKMPVADLRQRGAQGVKLLMYFNPYGSNTTTELETAKSILEESHQENLPFFLEIMTYGAHNPLSEQIMDALDLFNEYGITPDVWKLEYPGDALSCQLITNRVQPTPWILLTHGMSYPTFQENLRTAMEEGCRGFLAGRSIWQEIGKKSGEERERFLHTTARERFEDIRHIALENIV